MRKEKVFKNGKTKAKKKGKERTEREKEWFPFDMLPIELKHEVLKKLKTIYLEDVCSKVNQEWKGMVSDIVALREVRDYVNRIVPTRWRKELEKQVPPNCTKPELELLKIYESSILRHRSSVKAITVNHSALAKDGKGIIHKIWSSRPCDCKRVDECIVRNVQIINVMNLIVVQSSVGLQFFNLKDLELLHVNSENPQPYKCVNSANKIEKWFSISTSTDFSVFRDHIALEETPRTILLCQVISCDHAKRKVMVKRIRRIHLPLWSRSLCLLQNQLYVVYSTGHIGMWNRSEDELAITDNVVLQRLRTPTPATENHNSKLFRVGDLVFVKFRRDKFWEWFVHDPTEKTMMFHSIVLAGKITSGFLHEEPTWECAEVFYIGLYGNFLVVHCQVQYLISAEPRVENRILIKKVQRLPTLMDFTKIGRELFCEQFLVPWYKEHTKQAVVNGSVIPPFLPLSLKPCQLEPAVTEPVPVADMVLVEWTAVTERRKKETPTNRKKLKIHRIRIANRSRESRQRQNSVPDVS